MNKVTLVGNLGADPEVRFTPSGTPVANFRMATNESWTGKDGNRQERTEWHRIVVWGKLGETCGKYLSKGRQVLVEGRLQTRSWDKDGEKRYTTEIVAERVHFLDKLARGSDNVSASTVQEDEYAQDAEKQALHVTSEDVPF